METKKDSSEAFRETIDQICRVIREHTRFLIAGHVRPDGDCLGSQLALMHALEQLGKKTLVYNTGPIQTYYDFLPGRDRISGKIDKKFDPHVTCVLDCTGPDRVAKDFAPKGVVVNIDHHLTNERFGDINYADPNEMAVGAQIYLALTTLGVAITPDIATCLYIAILADTGGFRFSNTSSRTFELARELVGAGADPGYIARNYFESNSPESVLLKSKALINLHLECEGRLAWCEITQEMFKEAGGERHEPERLINEIRAINGVRIAMLITEMEGGGLRASFRSHGFHDMSVIAGKFGGGGHKNAAGCHIDGNYETAKERLLTELRKMFSSSS